MAVIFHIKDSEQFNKCHDALKGSPAYVSNEIMLTQDDDNNLYLIVGYDNDNDFNIYL